MRLILFRHGIAVDRDDPACPPDDERPLTPKGVRRTRSAARGLRAAGARPEAIYSSPLLRARQTAALAAEALDIPPDAVRITGHLRPEGDPAAVLALLARAGHAEALLAGHAPNLDRVLGAALRIRGEPPAALKKAGAAYVDWEPGAAGLLRWLLEPGALRRLGG